MHLTLVTHDNAKKKRKTSSPSIIMLPKSAVDHVAKMKAHQAQLDKELRQAQGEADCEEEERAEEAV